MVIKRHSFTLISLSLIQLRSTTESAYLSMMNLGYQKRVKSSTINTLFFFQWFLLVSASWEVGASIIISAPIVKEGAYHLLEISAGGVLSFELHPDRSKAPKHQKSVSDLLLSLEKLDRSTVSSTGVIATALTEIQSVLDDATLGITPVGIGEDTVPFDIDPARLDRGSAISATHFEQVYERAASEYERAIYVDAGYSGWQQIVKFNRVFASRTGTPARLLNDGQECRVLLRCLVARPTRLAGVLTNIRSKRPKVR